MTTPVLVLVAHSCLLEAYRCKLLCEILDIRPQLVNGRWGMSLEVLPEVSHLGTCVNITVRWKLVCMFGNELDC
jgi:hypothetical protein